MELTNEDVLNILRIIDQSSCEELHLEIGDFKLIVRKKGADSSAAVSAPARSGDGSEAARPAASLAAWPEGGAEPVALQGVREAASASRTGSVRPVRQGGVEVKAPMVGTFYRAPAPGAPPFVEVGSQVTEDDTMCIIEVMKLMNSIKAGCRGRVVEICAENGAMVEFGQTLMVIEPLP
ncbi:MAG: acetyl-CoA carboxylase biotin carboxyl carrier protein [Candidatus Rokubacteria bacterium]|nr:acetyl-CoA carboxylase biotin carboxyl carrier protein [Candidatus Rokubacteria bacterium]